MINAAQSLIQDAVAAMQRGDAETARALLQEIVSAGEVAPPWILLAQACRMAGDQVGERDALDKLLIADPRNVRALLMKGDWYARIRDERAATSFYCQALKVAPHAGELPEGLVVHLRRAEQFTQEASLRYRDHLGSRLAAAGRGADRLSGRMQESLDILLGRKQPYFQEPTSFFFPGLPHTQFYEREDFAWLPTLEAAAEAMRVELEQVLEEQSSAFHPYVQAHVDRPYNSAHKMLDNAEWSAFYLWKDGSIVAENAARCPRTMEALAHAPLPHIKSRSPMALFSLLRPGAHIPPHNGMLNTRLICHIPLIVPPDCRLRVGNEIRAVEQGKALIFDDSIEHEAWNDSDRTRVVLLFEVWRPELSELEKEALTVLFEAINDYQSPPRNSA